MTDLTTEAGRQRVASQARQWRPDAAVAVGVTAVQLAAQYESLSWHGHPSGASSWAIYVLLTVAGLALFWRRGSPTAVLAVSLGATLWAGALGGGFIWIALIAAFINAAVAGKHIAAAVSLVIGYVVNCWPPWLIGTAGHLRPAWLWA